MLGLRKKPAPAPAPAAEAGSSEAAPAPPDADPAAPGGPAVAAPPKTIGIFGPSRPGGRALGAADLRIAKDMRDLEESDAVKFSHPEPGNLRILRVVIKPDRSSWWYPGTYEFTVTVGDEYPHKAPQTHCNTQVYHPNIDLEGHVCLNILRADWNPVLSLFAVLNGLLFLFYEPNPLDPLNLEAAALLRSDVEAFKRKVAMSLRGGAMEGKVFPRFT